VEESWGSSGSLKYEIVVCGGHWPRLRDPREVKRIVEDSSADLQEMVSAGGRSAHLLALVHSAIDEAVHRRFDNRRRHPQPGSIPGTVVDQATALTVGVPLQLEQQAPGFARCHTNFGSAPVVELVSTNGTCQAIQACLHRVLLSMPEAPMQAFQFALDRCLCLSVRGDAGRKAVGRLLHVLQPHCKVEPVKNWQYGIAMIAGGERVEPLLTIRQHGQMRRCAGAQLMHASLDRVSDRDAGGAHGGEYLSPLAGRSMLPTNTCMCRTPAAGTARMKAPSIVTIIGDGSEMAGGSVGRWLRRRPTVIARLCGSPCARCRHPVAGDRREGGQRHDTAGERPASPG